MDRTPVLKRLVDERWCYRRLRSVRWPKGVRCVRCGSGHVTTHTRFPGTARKKYLCLACHRTFTDLTGTVFTRSKVRLWKWFLCLHLMGRKMSTLELAEELKVNKDTAWRMRKLLAESLSRGKLVLKLKGMVEVDETYAKTSRRRRGTHGGRPRPEEVKGILGCTERQGGLMLRALPNVGTRSIARTVMQCVERQAQVITDNFSGYGLLRGLGYHREEFNHTTGEYVRGVYHTNTIESHFSHLKTKLRIFRGVRHLPRYLSEYEFFHNARRQLLDPLTEGLKLCIT